MNTKKLCRIQCDIDIKRAEMRVAIENTFKIGDRIKVQLRPDLDPAMVTVVDHKRAQDGRIGIEYEGGHISSAHFSQVRSR